MTKKEKQMKEKQMKAKNQPKRKMGQTVRVKKREYDELLAANELLCRILDDQGDLIHVYWHEYPDMMEAAGFEPFEYEEDEVANG